MPFVLYECETGSHTLREEHELKVFENRVLWKIFAPEMKNELKGWKKLHNEKPHNLYPSPDIFRVIKSIKMGRSCGMYGEEEMRIQGFGRQS